MLVFCESEKFKSDPQQLISFSKQVLDKEHNNNPADKAVERFSEKNQVLAVTLECFAYDHIHTEATGTAFIDLGDIPDSSSCECDTESQNENVDVFAEMLLLTSEKFKTRIQSQEESPKRTLISFKWLVIVLLKSFLLKV